MLASLAWEPQHVSCALTVSPGIKGVTALLLSLSRARRLSLKRGGALVALLDLDKERDTRQLGLYLPTLLRPYLPTSTSLALRLLFQRRFPAP